jgi:uncharacterized protein (DUF433 family)
LTKTSPSATATADLTAWTAYPYCGEQIEVLVDPGALRWHPLGFGTPIVLDPRRALGAPIIESVGVPTEFVAEVAHGGDPVSTIAAWYGVEEFEVRSALQHEGVNPDPPHVLG